MQDGNLVADRLVVAKDRDSKFSAAFDAVFAATDISSRVGPASGDEVGVPAQQGSRRDEPEPAELRGQQSADTGRARSHRVRVR